MNTNQILITVVVIQQGFLGLLWLGAAWLRMARRPSWHWAAATLLMAAGMSLLVEREALGNWLGRWLPNAINLLAFSMAARGTALFVRAPTRDGENFGIAGAAIGVSALVLLAGGESRWITALGSCGMAWIALRTALLAGRGLADEFGRAAAWACGAPMVLVALLVGARGLGAVLGLAVGAPLDHGGSGQTLVILGFVVVGLTANAGFGGMVVLRLVMRLRHASLHDPLTGLPNRRSFEHALALEHARLRRGGRPYALLAIDADHFKRINDRHGHAGGDAALVHLARRLRAVARGGDVVARVGGEEFVMLLPDTDRAGAHQAAARLLAAVREAPLAMPDGALRMTVSVGLAMAQSGTEPMPALWRRADEALYAAKAAGRDRVVDDAGGAPGAVPAPAVT